MRTSTSIPVALLVGVLLLLGGCTPRKNRPLKLDPATLAQARVWKTDPLGCNGLRTDDLGAALAEAIQQQSQVYAAQVIELLGEPEFTHTRNEFRVLGYYYWGKCVDGTIPDGEVYCTLEFFFESEDGPLHEAGVVCG